MELSFAVVPARRPGCEEEAQRWAKELGVPFIERGHRGLNSILLQTESEALLIAAKEGPILYTKEGGKLAYHPGMAVLRWQRLLLGEKDHFITACDLKKGSRLLDCTLGLGSDAALASAVAGREGRVVGLEASPLIFFLTSRGLKNYFCEDEELTAALRRIETVQATAADYLTSCEENFDVIYFDPMFRRHLRGSAAMDALQPLAHSEPLTQEIIDLALKRAPRAVIKEGDEKVLAALGCTSLCGGKYAKVKYGVLTR